MDRMERMREDWDRRAREDANYYAGFGRRGQDDREFLAGGAEVVDSILKELVRLPPAPASERRALEIGCGPGRLMLPMSEHFGKVHGIDVSPEMAALARARLSEIPHARVHVTSGEGLAIFGDDAFDFIYSYAVFQHIPDPAAVLNYVRESRRVLKPGGVLCCQVRGAPPLASEMKRESDTWTGCWFTDEQMAAFAREQDFHLVTLSGVGTQYMWTTWVRPESGIADRAPGEARPGESIAETQPGIGGASRQACGAGAQAGFSKAEATLGRAGAAARATNSEAPRPTVLKAATPAEGDGRRWWPGPDAAVSLWIDGLPRGCHLGNMEVAFGDRRARGCYLTSLSESGACQMNAWLPDDVPPGPTHVALYWEGRKLCEAVAIEIPPPERRLPRMISVSDGVNIASKHRVETGGVKATITDVERPEEVSFTIDGLPVRFLQFERKGPIRSTCEFAFRLPLETQIGTRVLEARASGVSLPPVAIEVAGLTEEDAPQADQANQQHGGEAREAGGPPLQPAVKRKGNLARAIARWFQHEKV